MTQTIDPTTAEAPELRRWLAEQPCLELVKAGLHMHVENCHGLANQWASEECTCTQLSIEANLACTVCWRITEHSKRCERCNGSGRVPKDVGLEKVLEQEYMVVIEGLSRGVH